MITNNVNFLQLVILSMAKECYEVEIVNSGKEASSIGEGLTWESKEHFMSDYISSHFNKAKESIIEGSLNSNESKNKNEIITPENTIAMRMYSLDIGEAFDFDNFNRIVRFPGGWIFQSELNKKVVFIPYNTEFCVEKGILAHEFKKTFNGTENCINEK